MLASDCLAPTPCGPASVPARDAARDAIESVVRLMAPKKQRRFGNPLRQAQVEAEERARALAAQAAAVATAAQRRADAADADCATGCCG